MAFSIDVNLPRRHKATFPEQCVVCGRQFPNSTVRLITGTLGWWTWILWIFGRPFVVKAPACKFCGWRLQFQRAASVGLTIVFVWLALSWCWPLIADHVPAGARKLVMFGIGIAAIVPQALFSTFFPPPIDITAYSESVDYEFRDLDLAAEFAILNLDSGKVTVNGKPIFE